jgi:uncharacterized protein with HEPN domain
MPRDRAFIEHILDSITAIETFIQGVNKEKFLKERMIRGAVVREIEVMGEAAKNISRETRKKYPDIPWKKMTGMRDKLIHHYFGLDFNVIWDTIREEIPKLKKQMMDIIDQL